MSPGCRAVARATYGSTIVTLSRTWLFAAMDRIVAE
jgi:hypothetical protein